jgi:SAM-dependent methyltransferase
MNSEEPRSAQVEYPARTGYLESEVPAQYESRRFSGLMGRYRFSREQQGVGDIIDLLPANLTILDCPCGTGRWWALLERKASSLIAQDISPAMLEVAETRAASMDLDVSLAEGDAENLDLEDGSVDAVFCHALTKHLPIPVQYRVLSELARVSREHVVCSFSIFSRFTYELWRRRDFADSYPLLPHQLRDMAGSAGLEIVTTRRCSTPVGVEHSVLLRKA